MKLKGLVLFQAAVIVAFVGGACKKNEAPVITIGISVPSADHGWTAGVVFWAEHAKTYLQTENPGVKVIVSTAQDSAEQVNQIENMLTTGIQTLVVLPNEPEPLMNICEQAKKSGVKLVVVDRGLPKDIADVTVVGDNKMFGRVAGEQLQSLLNGSGKIVIMEGTPCAVNSDRVESFRAVISKYPNIKVLASDTANWNTEKGLTLMENFLQKFDHIDAVWAGDDDVLVGALKAYIESKRSDIKCFIGGGGSKTIIEKIMQKNPVVPLTVTYPPKMIYEAAKYGLDISKGKSVEKRIVLPAEVINNSNAKAFYVPESSY